MGLGRGSPKWTPDSLELRGDTGGGQAAGLSTPHGEVFGLGGTHGLTAIELAPAEWS